MATTRLLIFAVTYVLIAVQQFPGVRLNRPAASLLGAVATPGGTYPNAWNKFVPRPIYTPPHPATWRG